MVLGKIVIIGCLWSLFFIEGIRVILLINWHFDIFWPQHWVFLWQTWHDGWVIRHAKEWAFILILLAAIPMWLTGWIALSLISWKKLFYLCFTKPFLIVKSFIADLKAPLRNELALTKVVKKRSYKEIRPTMHGTTSSSENYELHPVSVAIKTPPSSVAKKPVTTAKAPSVVKEEEKKPFTHSVFEFDDDDDDFDFDFERAVKPAKKVAPEPIVEEDYEAAPENKFSKPEKIPYGSDINFDEFDNLTARPDNRKKNSKSGKNETKSQRDDGRREKAETHHEFEKVSKKKNESHGDRTAKTEVNNPIVETIRQKGYEIITGASIKNTYIDYIAVSNHVLYLCLVDKEIGDWLADEEQFNDEEPLWFSENSHRVSPVRLVDIARNALAEKLNEYNITYDLRAFVIVQNGNIINAEDMFEIWNRMDISVTRINRGAPREIPLFSKSMEDVEDRIDTVKFESLKKLIRSIA